MRDPRSNSPNYSTACRITSSGSTGSLMRRSAKLAYSTAARSRSRAARCSRGTRRWRPRPAEAARRARSAPPAGSDGALRGRRAPFLGSVPPAVPACIIVEFCHFDELVMLAPWDPLGHAPVPTMGPALADRGSPGTLDDRCGLRRAPQGGCPFVQMANGSHRDVCRALPTVKTSDVVTNVATILDHGINVEESPEPVRLAERGW